MTWVEAALLMLPAELGRTAAVFPRDGSYRPFARIDQRMTRVRLMEGPPRIAPGEEARVMIEIEAAGIELRRGVEFPLLERNERVVGLVTVLRVCHEELSV